VEQRNRGTGRWGYHDVSQLETRTVLGVILLTPLTPASIGRAIVVATALNVVLCAQAGYGAALLKVDIRVTDLTVLLATVRFAFWQMAVHKPYGMGSLSL